MLLYILKSSLCLLILVAFYKLFLERTSFHLFKRFFLLGAILLSVIIPLITLTTYVEPEYILGSFDNDVAFQPLEFDTQAQPKVQTSYWPIILWSFYAIGILVFLIKFAINLGTILKKINANPKFKNTSFINVLLKELTVPHTFFKYVFVNKHKFENNEIPKDVLLHEAAHAKQKHTLDVIFAELFQTVFWFNPLVYVLKKDIKLNHEFLADSAVLNEGSDKQEYKKLLLNYSSNHQTCHLTHAINYSSIKKRLTVMNTNTTKRSFWIRSMLLLPLLTFMVYGFSDKKEVTKHVEPLMNTENVTDISETSSRHTARSITITILDENNYDIDGIKATKSSLANTVNTLHQDITPEIRNNIMNIHVTSENEISNEEVWFIYNSLFDYGFHRLVTEEQEVVKSKGNTPFAIDAQNIQQSATRKQMAEYNRLAKHYNAMLERKSNITIKMKDVEKLKYIYNLMSRKQRKDAEPFPDFPEPPPPPEAPDAPTFIEKEVEVPVPPKPVKHYGTEKEIELPAPPPAPKAPPTMEELAEKGAVFYYEGKPISSKKAIDIVSNNKRINIQIIDVDSKQPTVKLSKKPITIKKKSSSNNSKIKVETGNIKINGQDHFYSKRNGTTSYFNNNGQQVDKTGQLVETPSGKNPSFYYNGKQISSSKANRLLSNNKSIAVTNKNFENGNYALILSDININANTINHNANKNLNNNPNSLIDLTEVINKGASFYFDDEPISTEEALKLTNGYKIARVQTINKKQGKPKVYFWSK